MTSLIIKFMQPLKFHQSIAACSENVPTTISIFAPNSTHPMITLVEARVFKPKVFVANYSSPVDLSSVPKALQSNEWKQAMQEEYSTLVHNNT